MTAGNASPLTDGGSAVLMMSEERAKSDGLEPMGFVRSYAFSGLDPAGQLLQGPAYAAPIVLDRASVTMADIGLMEMHEAFSAQVLSNLQALSSQKFAEEELGRSQAVGHPDVEQINVMGGSIAIGHPFGATGARDHDDALERDEAARCGAGFDYGLRGGADWGSRWWWSGDEPGCSFLGPSTRSTVPSREPPDSLSAACPPRTFARPPPWPVLAREPAPAGCSHRSPRRSANSRWCGGDVP